jgi:hypothetical protein
MGSEEGMERRLCGWSYCLGEREKWRFFIIGPEGKEFDPPIKVLAARRGRKSEEVVHPLC